MCKQDPPRADEWSRNVTGCLKLTTVNSLFLQAAVMLQILEARLVV